VRRRDEDEMVRNAGTFVALFGLLLAAAGLFLVIVMVLPQMAGILVVVMGFVLLVGTNYAIWGWWYTELAQDEDEEPAVRARESLDVDE
jgi:Flp pilus assembly protein TadB